MWIWLDRAKWQLECMPEKFFLSLSLPSTEPAILPRKNLMFLESQTSHWANMDPKTGCNKMRSAERYRPSLIGSGVRSWVQSLWPLNVMVRFFLTENVNDMKNRSYQFNMSCKINSTEARSLGQVTGFKSQSSGNIQSTFLLWCGPGFKSQSSHWLLPRSW